jgi:hypothetical protein
MMSNSAPIKQSITCIASFSDALKEGEQYDGFG